ncbi:MAG: class I SAM-dependent methyltransferase [Myxococcales bacterium]|nr:class I SAM-dependent methyltransferase [Myxococcales bacterium]
MPSSTDRDAARGQYRTTTTDFTKVPPYVRFRYERAAEFLPDHGQVVELGCGVGVGLSHLAKSRPDLSFRGVDMSEGAIEYGRRHFGTITNLELAVQPASLETLANELKPGTFLVALEVLEHLDDTTLHIFKTKVMENVDAAFFSFPYDQKDIIGTDHLQSFTIYDIFEMFPGFETVFIRRHSIKFIGYWERRRRGYVREHLGVAKEADAIARIANTSARHGPTPQRQSALTHLRRLREWLFR